MLVLDVLSAPGKSFLTGTDWTNLLIHSVALEQLTELDLDSKRQDGKIHSLITHFDEFQIKKTILVLALNM